MDSIINQALSNTNFNILLAIFLAITAGQTIQPVPKVLNYLYNNSFLFKYIILILFGLRVFYPVNNKKIIVVFISAFILLYTLEILRCYDK